ncbi:hypothetical protein [Segatella baroniae]|uniref:hypothetical protein n=1 Tax=Segatella baroniae TaxID=305719 RepID=UPI00046FC511|nr:hypothetical protein [Segatella baroniae]
MKKYIKPEMKSKLIELENCILAGSIDIGISEDPATGPALSKGNNFFDDDEDDAQTTTTRSLFSLWDD